MLSGGVGISGSKTADYLKVLEEEKELKGILKGDYGIERSLLVK